MRASDEQGPHYLTTQYTGRRPQAQKLQDRLGLHYTRRHWKQLKHLFGYTLVILLIHVFGVDSMEEPKYPEPVFLERLDNVTAREGGKAVLPCAVLYLGTKEVTWRRLGENHFLSVGSHMWVKDSNLHLHYNELTPEVTEWNLIIRNVTPEHAGTYECKITDQVKLVRYIDLDVVGPPIVETVTRPPIAISGKNYVEMGQAITIFCNATEPPGTPVTIDWFKDGDTIDYIKYKHVVITNYHLVETNVLVSELLIDRSQPRDTGTYICRSPNGHIDSIKVTVLSADTNNVKRAGNPSSMESSATHHQCLVVATVIGALLTAAIT